jgi:quercetin dioxygenase-like cupin family protein
MPNKPDKSYGPNIQQLECLIHGGETIAGKGGWSNGMAKLAQVLYNDADMAIDRVTMPAGTIFKDHAHSLTEVLICVSGQLSVRTTDEHHQLRRADVLKISAGTVHSCEAVEDAAVIGILVAAESLKSQGPVL